MQFSKSTGYALHALVQLAAADRGTNLSIHDVAAFLGVSESYLSKVMSKLTQAGLLRSTPGVSGGYELAKPASGITFADVVQAIEGRRPLYECSRYDEHRHALYQKPGLPKHKPGECLVQVVMNGAERRMQAFLREHSIQWVLDNSGLPSHVQ